jgi:hypothetical protein
VIKVPTRRLLGPVRPRLIFVPHIVPQVAWVALHCQQTHCVLLQSSLVSAFRGHIKP